MIGGEITTRLAHSEVKGKNKAIQFTADNLKLRLYTYTVGSGHTFVL